MMIQQFLSVEEVVQVLVIHISYTSSTTESFYIFVEDSPKNNNSSTAGDFVVNFSISPTSSSTGLELLQ